MATVAETAHGSALWGYVTCKAETLKTSVGVVWSVPSELGTFSDTWKLRLLCLIVLDDVVDGYGSVEEWWPEWKSDVVVLCSEVGKNIFSIRCLQFFKWAWKMKKSHRKKFKIKAEKISFSDNSIITQSLDFFLRYHQNQHEVHVTFTFPFGTPNYNHCPHIRW